MQGGSRLGFSRRVCRRPDDHENVECMHPIILRLTEHTGPGLSCLSTILLRLYPLQRGESRSAQYCS
jgi:hypothetical protein